MVLNSILQTYSEIGQEITDRIKEFKLIWQNANDKELFEELAFCLLTPQSKAVNAGKAIEELSKSQLLYNGNKEAIADVLNIVRFKNNKAGYIIEARTKFLKDDKFVVKQVFEEMPDILERRKWLFKNVKGIGMKEASHFLRNVGFVEEITILDRHILKNLKASGVIDEIPKSITYAKYIEIEEKMKQYSKEINIPLSHLDFVFWFMEAKKIYK